MYEFFFSSSFSTMLQIANQQCEWAMRRSKLSGDEEEEEGEEGNDVMSRYLPT